MPSVMTCANYLKLPECPSAWLKSCNALRCAGTTKSVSDRNAVGCYQVQLRRDAEAEAPVGHARGERGQASAERFPLRQSSHSFPNPGSVHSCSPKLPWKSRPESAASAGPISRTMRLRVALAPCETAGSSVVAAAIACARPPPEDCEARAAEVKKGRCDSMISLHWNLLWRRLALVDRAL